MRGSFRSGPQSSRPTVASLSCVQVFTGAAPCQVVDSEEEPEDGEEEVGRSFSNGHKRLALLAGTVDKLAMGALIRQVVVARGTLIRQQEEQWWPPAACCSWPALMFKLLHHPIFRISACNQASPLLAVHTWWPRLQCVGAARVCRPQTPHSSRRDMLSGRLQSVRGLAVLPVLQIIDFLRSPPLR